MPIPYMGSWGQEGRGFSSILNINLSSTLNTNLKKLTIVCDYRIQFVIIFLNFKNLEKFWMTFYRKLGKNCVFLRFFCRSARKNLKRLLKKLKYTQYWLKQPIWSLSWKKLAWYIIQGPFPLKNSIFIIQKADILAHKMLFLSSHR